MDKYPFVLIPDPFIADGKLDQLLQDRAEILSSLKEPSIPLTPNYNVTVPEVTTLLASLAITAFISVNIHPLIGFIILGFGLFLISISGRNREINQELTSKFKNQMEDYHKARESYDHKISSIDEINDDITKLRLNAYNNCFSRIRLYRYVKNINVRYNSSRRISKKGVSERLLFNRLKDIYGDKITNKIILTVKYSGIYGLDKYDLLPDIVYYDPNKNMLIDIEIDEPYDLVSLTPIHYKSEDETPTHDEWRDNLFVSCNWFVVRFAEEQVVKELDNCIIYLNGLINTVKGSYNFHWHKSVTPIKRWNYNEAYFMANNNYRNKYLNSLLA